MFSHSVRVRLLGAGAVLFAAAAPLVFAGSAEAYVCKATYTSVHSSGFAKPAVMAKARTH